MAKKIRILANAVTAKQADTDKQVSKIISEALSYEVKQGYGVQYSWIDKRSFFNKKEGTFPAGFVNYIIKILRQKGYEAVLIRKALPEPLGDENPVVDSLPYNSNYDYQMQVVRKVESKGGMIAMVATGGGKCLGKGTEVLMFDGTIKKVEDVVSGDLLMGPDSKAKTVLSVCSGVETLYNVIPTKGNSYVVNESHILSLRITGVGRKKVGGYRQGKVVNISVNDYLSKSATFKHCAKGWRTGVDFESGDALDIPPYILGIWLGDGHSKSPSITNADIEVLNEWMEYAYLHSENCKVVIREQRGCVTSDISRIEHGKPSEIRVGLKKYNLFNNKHIPHCYKTSSLENRLELLAGIIDTDGCEHHSGFDIVIKQEVFANDIAYVCRSVGLAAYVKKCKKGIKSTGFTGTYYRISISGDTSVIPCRVARRKTEKRLQKKNVLNVGIRVEKIGVGEYYGFELDGDGLFLLGDFTVTHNTRIAKLLYSRIKRKTLFITTRSALMYQMHNIFQSVEKNIGVIGDGIYQPSEGFNVGMVQTFVSMLKMPDKGADARKIAEQLNRRQRVIALLKSFELVILEEAHEVSGDGYYQVLKMCTKAYYRLALTATPFMKQNSEANMRLMAVSGPIGIRVTEKQLIDCGILAKPYFKFLRLPKPDRLKRGTPWPSCYNIGVVDNEIRNQAIVDEATKAVKHKLPTLILVNRQAHGDNLKKMLISKGIRTDFIYGKHEAEQRMDALEKIKNGKYQVLIGSTILDVGVDVPAIGMVIIACGYKEEVALRQRIGRGLRKKKGANVTFIVCFADEHNHHLAKHAKIRREVISGTPGFRDGILDDGDDFDYGLLKS